MYVYMYAFVCLNAMHMNADAGQKKALNPWALEPRVVVSPLAWALGMEPRSLEEQRVHLSPEHLSSPIGYLQSSLIF